MTHASRAGAAALAFLLIASPLVAQTAGRIQGTVTDNTGAPVPGVAVHATSPSLQGVQSAVTDAKGEFRFASVPPGTYAVKSELSGFKTFNQTGIVVGLDRTVTLTFKMEVAAVAETVTVTGESPVIDTASTTTGVNATADLFNRIPVQRDIYSIARVAAGHAERRRRRRRSTARPAPRTTTSSTASTRPASRSATEAQDSSTSTSSRRSRSRPAGFRPSTAA